MELNKENIKKIAIFRALQLGDMMCAVPAFRALRHAFPEAHITLIGLPWAQTFVDRYSHYFDDFIQFPGYPGLPEQKFDPKKFTAFLAGIQYREYDLVLQMQGNGTIVNHMIELFGSEFSAGFFYRDDFRPNDLFFVEYPEGISEIDRHLVLMEYLGISSKGRYLEFPVTERDHSDYKKSGLDLNIKKYVCVHPGSRGAWRQWPPEHFASLARYCHEQGFEVVLTGTKDEAEIIQQVISHLDFDVINAVGKTSLGAIAVLIENAYLLIANCTGVSHIASATKTPSIIISMDGEPERWAPLNQQIHRTIDWTRNQDFDTVFSETLDLFKQLSLANEELSGPQQQYTETLP